MKKNGTRDENAIDKRFHVSTYQIPLDKFFQFGVSIDCVVFGYENGRLKVLLIKRGVEPFKGTSALPGDLVYPNEEIGVAARRILGDLTGIKDLYLQQTKSYGRVDRHPIGRVITIGYYALINIQDYSAQPLTWADEVFWQDMTDLPVLAFDHSQILLDAVEALQNQVRQRPVGFELLPEKFTLGELQELYQALLNERYDKANFRKKFLSMGLLKSLKESQTDVPHRPGRLYSFDEQRYHGMKSQGFSFEFK